MPAKNTIRNFRQGGYYHVFNRGVEKRQIFLDEQDYIVFSYYLFVYLSPLEIVVGRYPELRENLKNKNLHEHIELISYCLMPNHFHFVLKLRSEWAISALLKQITNAYTGYFNDKYSRVGSLMQGKYKSIEVTRQSQLLHLSRYVHMNPKMASLCQHAEQYKWSSMQDYYSGKFRHFLSTALLDDNRLTSKQYVEFVTRYDNHPNPIEMVAANELIERVAIED